MDDKTWAILFLVVSIIVLGVSLILRGRKGPRPQVRSISAFQGLRDEAGLAAESGGTVHIALGGGGLTGENAVTSLAALQVVEALADTAVLYNASPIITVGDPTLLPLAQDIMRRAHERHNLMQRYDATRVRFVAPTPLSYAAGAGYVLANENVTANIIAGDFGAEVSLITDAGTRRSLPQLGAVAAPEAAGALFPATENLAIGEELFSAGAQITGERRYLASLSAQDILRVLIILAILLLSAARLLA